MLSLKQCTRREEIKEEKWMKKIQRRTRMEEKNKKKRKINGEKLNKE